MGAILTAVAKVTDRNRTSGGVDLSLEYISGRRGMAEPQDKFPTKVKVTNGVADVGSEIEVVIRESGGKCKIVEARSGRLNFEIGN